LFLFTQVELEGTRLDNEHVLGFLRLLLPAGAETTYRLTGSCIYALLTHPEVYEEVRADRSVIELLIQETLRWESPVQFVSREATEDLEFSGQHVAAGAMLSVTVGSANRDERHYAEPDRFDLYRKNDDHLAFGFGAHFCAGSHLLSERFARAVSSNSSGREVWTIMVNSLVSRQCRASCTLGW
jgi:cytochrome P450